MSDDVKASESAGTGFDLGSMLAKVRGEVSVTRLDWQDIVPREQSRKSFKGIEELAASIESVGQVQPIIVRPAQNGQYVIRSGERRWRACKMLNRPVDAIVRADQESEALELASELVENIQRDNLTPMETAMAFKQLVDDGHEQREIAEAVGKSKQYVSMHLAIVNLPEPVLELHDEEVTRDTDTLNTLRKLYDINAELAEDTCRKALLHGITRAQAKALLKEAKQAEKGEFGALTATDWQGNAVDPARAQVGAGEEGGADTGAGEPSQPPTETTVPDMESLPFDIDTMEGDPTEGSTPAPVGKEKKASEQKPASERGDGWTAVSRGGIRITVSFQAHGGEGDHRWGELMTERVDDDKAYLWVRAAGEGGEEEHRVLAEEVTIMAAEVLVDA